MLKPGDSEGFEDPTAFKIDFDPTVQRMRGVAIHGNTPFDVPFVSEITDNLWTGGCENGLVLPTGVKHLISLYKWESYQVKHSLSSALTVTMYDSSDGVELGQLLALASWVNVCRQTGLTLVHCQAGLNRSGLVAATALILEGMTPDDAVALLREKRSPAVLCNQTFLAQLASMSDGQFPTKQSVTNW